MGSLLIQIGQCGCQIGMEVNESMSTLTNTYLKRPKSQIIHSIMLDTQPKIIKPLILNRQKYKYLDPKNLKYFQYGRANNWSYGYLDSTKYKPDQHTQQKIKFKKVFSQDKPLSFVQKYFNENKSIIEFTMEAVRNQLQKTTTFLGVNVLCSLGGGTGSGLGTRIVEEIRNNFDTRIICHSVLPNESGETPLQHYNCALSISSMYEHANAIFTYENDKCTSLFQKQEEQVSLKTINKYIGNTISSILSINDISGFDRYYFDLVDQCVISPDLKFLEAYCSYNPAKNSQWEDVMTNIYNQLQNSNRDDNWKGPERKQKTLFSQILFKGNQQAESEKYLKRLKTLLNPIQNISINQVQKKQYQKECLVIANRTRITRYLSDLIEKGEKKLSVGAYIWNYMVDIEPAFQTLHNIVESYQQF